MQHTTATESMVRILDKFKQTNSYTVDGLRERMKELAAVSDEEIINHWEDLWEAAKCRRRCGGCFKTKGPDGYLDCWMPEDIRGHVIKADVVEGRLVITRPICGTRLAYEARERQHSLLDDSGMTDEDRSYTFDNFPAEQERKHRKIVAYARDFADTFEIGQKRKGLYIFGTNGIGKTHLTKAVTNRLNERGVLAMFVRADKIIDQMREAIAKGGDPDEVLYRYQTAPVLVIDEFGQERKTDWSLDQIQKLVYERDRRGLPTWYTSNYQPTDVYEAHYRFPDTERIDAIRSRLFLAQLANMVGEDWRSRAIDETFWPEGGQPHE